MALPAAYDSQSAATSSGLPFASASLSLADLEGQDGAAKAGGIERRFLCPLPSCAGHRNPKLHRSLTLNTQSGAWNCKRCHAKGLLKEWHTHQSGQEGRPFVSKRDRDRDRLRSLLATAPRPAASKAEPDPETARDLAGLLLGIKPLAGTKGAAYLEGRGLPTDFCKGAGVRFHRGFLGRPAVVFSLRDAAGRIVALHGRYTDGRSDPKSRTRGPMPHAVFATPGAWSGDPWQGRVVITEAPIDALTLAFCGVPALALCGTSGGKELLRDRLALRQAVAAFDNDEDAKENAGHKAGKWLADLLLPVGCQVFRLLPPSGAKDWNEALQSIGPDALRAYLAAELSDGAIMPQGINSDVRTVTDVEMGGSVIPQGIKDGTSPIIPRGIIGGEMTPENADSPAFLCRFVPPSAAFSCSDAVLSPENAENPRRIAPNRQEIGKNQASFASASAAAVPPVGLGEVAALLAFVQAAYWGTGADIRMAVGRIAWIENGRVTAFWNGPTRGKLRVGVDYWKAASPFFVPDRWDMVELEI